MGTFNFQSVINILGEVIRDNQLDIEQIDQAIDTLESIKSTIDAEDDEVIDKVDELQDYLQYLLTIEEPSIEEVKEELSDIISNLKK